jgi:hypothetical protein
MVRSIFCWAMGFRFPCRCASSRAAPMWMCLPAHAVKTFEALDASDITLTFLKGGDHRLSTAVQLRIMQETVLQLAERADGVRY